MGLFFDKREIKPFVQGDYLFNKAGCLVNKFTSKEVQVRALVEGQFIALRAQIEDTGFSVDGEGGGHIVATGGASENRALLQVLSDVWGLPVYALDSADSAVLGAAYQAKHALARPDRTFYEVTSATSTLVCQPHADSTQIYGPMVERYRLMVAALEKDARQ